MVGPYTGPHSADFLRAPALYRYGGVWMDSSCILFRDLDRICWDKLTDEESPFTVGAVIQYGTVMANAFVAARKGDVFIKKWHEIFMELWKGQTDWSAISASPLILPILQKMDFGEAAEAGFKWTFTVDLGMCGLELFVTRSSLTLMYSSPHGLHRAGAFLVPSCISPRA